MNRFDIIYEIHISLQGFGKAGVLERSKGDDAAW